jgi:hypothetical protein
MSGVVFPSRHRNPVCGSRQQQGRSNTSMTMIQRSSAAMGPISPRAVPTRARRLPPCSCGRLIPPTPKPTAANPRGSPKTAQPNWGMARLTTVALTPKTNAVFARLLSDVLAPPRAIPPYFGGRGKALKSAEAVGPQRHKFPLLIPAPNSKSRENSSTNRTRLSCG